MKRAYTVELTTRPVEDLSDELLDAFAAQLLRDRKVAGAVPAADRATHTLTARMSVDAGEPHEALAIAVGSFRRATSARPLRDVDVVVIAEASVALEREGAGDRGELVSTAEIAQRLGVTRQRVWQLVSEKGHFPAPRATFGTTSVWRWGDVADWAEVNERTVRRRRKKAS